MSDMIRVSNNPKAALEHLVYSNPNYKQVMDFVAQNGGNPKTAFYALAKQNGADPDQFVSIFR